MHVYNLCNRCFVVVQCKSKYQYVNYCCCCLKKFHSAVAACTQQRTTTPKNAQSHLSSAALSYGSAKWKAAYANALRIHATGKTNSSGRSQVAHLRALSITNASASKGSVSLAVLCLVHVERCVRMRIRDTGATNVCTKCSTADMRCELYLASLLSLAFFITYKSNCLVL